MDAWDKVSTFRLTLPVAFVIAYLCSNYSCSLADDDHTCRIPSFPPRRSYATGATYRMTQVIIPTMNFSGYGVIRSWTIFGRGIGRSSGNNAIELQLFEPNPTQSTVFTKVASTAVAVSMQRHDNIFQPFVVTGLDLTFSSGYLLGFYHLSTGGLFDVHNTGRYSTHKMLTSRNAVLRQTVIMSSAPVSRVPLISVSAVECMEAPHSPTEHSQPTEVQGLKTNNTGGIVAAVVLVTFVVAVVTVTGLTAVVLLFVGKKNRDQNRIRAQPSMYDSAVNLRTAEDSTYNKQLVMSRPYARPPTYDESTRIHQEVRPTGYSNPLPTYNQYLGSVGREESSCFRGDDHVEHERSERGSSSSNDGNCRPTDLHPDSAENSVNYHLHTVGTRALITRQPLPPISTDQP